MQMRVFVDFGDKGSLFKPVIEKVEVQTLEGNFVLTLDNPIIGISNYHYADGIVTYYFRKDRGAERLILHGIPEQDQMKIDEWDDFQIFIVEEELVPYIKATRDYWSY